ncbi:MAG: zf-HC2 domain-containing protein [bacterium]
MKCNEVIELLDAYIEGILAGDEHKRLASHLEECNSCKREFTELKEMLDGLRSVSVITVPADFTYRVADRINKYSSNKIADWLDFIFTPRVLRWNVAVAFSLVLLMGISLYLFPRNRFSGAEVINVKFQLELPGNYNGINTISLAGDFNGWDTKAMMLNPDGDNKWAIDVPLKKGRYQYMFVIDGKRWMPDPGAKKFIDDGFGGKNSLLEL